MHFSLSRRAWGLGLLGLLLAAVPGWSRTITVMAYNVENLVDADGRAVFKEYQGTAYTPAHVLTKVENIARVVGRINDGRGPDVILFAEIEVDLTPGPTPPDYDAVLRRYAGMKIGDMLGKNFDAAIADLPAEALLLKAFADHGLTGYRVVAADNVQTPGATRPLAQKCVVFTRLPVQAVHAWPTPDARAILEVDVSVDGAPLYLFDNHWKSGASDPRTETTRMANARTLRTRLDEILRADPQADIILGGDFNSQYNQSERYAATMPETGLNGVLRSQGDAQAVRGPKRDLYNLWYELPPAQRGSDTYHGEWGTLIQLIVSRGLLDYRGVQYVEHSFGVAKFPDLNMDPEGRPLRWSFDGPAGAGFSDHFPIYARFTTVSDNRPDRYLPVAPAAAAVAPAAAPVPVDYAHVDLAHAATVLPAGAVLRSPANVGKIFRVEGRIGPGRHLTVDFLGESYDVWSYDKEFRNRLRDSYRAGDVIRFYGELGQYKERWQFVVRDESWVK